MAKKQILVLFGPSGSGKSFFQTEFCKDAKFERIKKATTRTSRMGGIFKMFIVDDSSIKTGGIPNKSANYFSEIDGADGDFLTYNYGETYSTDLADIDSAFVQGKTPVIILRTRDQFEQLQSFYPDVELVKVYLRPDVEKCKAKIDADTARSETNKKERKAALDLDIKYHDETAITDKSVLVVENNYKNPEQIVEAIKSKIVPQKAVVSESEPKIVFGDQIRIRLNDGTYHPTFVCELIRNNTVINSFEETDKSFEEAYTSIADRLNKMCKVNINFESSFISENKNMETENLSKLNAVAYYAMDFRISHTGIDCWFSHPVYAHYRDEEDVRRANYLGNMRVSEKLKIPFKNGEQTTVDLTKTHIQICYNVIERFKRPEKGCTQGFILNIEPKKAHACRKGQLFYKNLSWEENIRKMNGDCRFFETLLSSRQRELETISPDFVYNNQMLASPGWFGVLQKRK